MSEISRTPGKAHRVRKFLTSRSFLLVLILAITIAAIYLAVNQVEKTKYIEVKSTLLGMPAWPYLLGFIGLLIVTIIRAARFHLLLHDTGAKFAASLELILIGYFFNALLPFRAGELVRIGYFSRRTPASVPSVTTAVIVERSLDMLALAILASVFLTDQIGRRIEGLPIPPWALAAAAGLGMLCIVGLGFLAKRRSDGIQNKPTGRLSRFIYEFIRALSSLGSATKIFLGVGLSLVLWLIVSLAIKIAFYSVDLNLPFTFAVVIMLGTCFSIALPAMPGYLGTYHAGFVGAALLVGINWEIALPVAIVFHFTILVPFLPIGGIVLYSGGRKLLARPPDQTEIIEKN